MWIIILYIIIVFMYIIEKITRKCFSNILPVMLLIYMIVVMGANTYNPDLNSGIHDVYYRIYMQEEIFIKDIGYGLIMVVFKNIGFSYEMFRMITSLVGILLINSTVKKYIKNTTLLYLIYIVYPFYLDVVQIRNFLMVSIIIFAIPNMIDKSKKSTIKSVILCIIAISIQKLGIIYLPFCFFKYIQKNKIKYFIYIIGILSVFIGISISALSNFMMMLQSIIGDQLSGLQKYYSMLDSGRSFFIHWIVQIMNFIFISYASYIINRLPTHEEEDFIKNKVVNFVWFINTYLFMFIMLYRIDITFTRIMRNITLLNLIAFFIVIEKIKAYKKLKRVFLHQILLKITFILSIGVAFYRYLLFSNIEYIIRAIIDNNWILGIK